jgi:RNA polymerase-associated protein CTR9
MEEMIRKREEFIEKTKNALVFMESTPEKAAKKRGRKKEDDDFVSDGSGRSGDENTEPKSRKKRGRKGEGGEGEERRGRTRQRRGRKEGSSKARKQKDLGEGLTAKQRRKIVSKETVSTSEESDGSDKEQKQDGSDMYVELSTIAINHNQFLKSGNIFEA